MRNAIECAVFVLVAGCGDPLVHTEPAPAPILAQCEAFCKKIEDECGYGPVGSSWEHLGVEPWDDCPRDCTDSRPSGDPCRREKLALTECQTAQSCEQLRWEYVVGALPPDGEDGCENPRNAVHLCNLEHFPPSSASD